MNTRRYPRTMQQAFGPYTDHNLLPMRQPRKPRRARRFLQALVAFLRSPRCHL